MAQEVPETTYEPEVEEDARRKRERRVVQEGTALWRRRKEELQRQKHREQRELQEILANYSPWGKPGGGAPCAATLRKKNVPLEPLEPPGYHSFGQLVHPSPWGRPGPGGAPWRDPKSLGVRFLESMGWTSNSTIDRLYKRNTDPPAVVDVNKFYDDRASPGIASETQPVQDPRNFYKEEVQVYELTGGVELVPLLTSRRHQSYPQTRRYLATDATRPGYTIESFRALGVGNREYIADLAEQIRRKRDRALEERRIEQESCRRHFDTWKRLWGRPGHGAPIDHARRNNLYNILHRPAIY
ncbi:uncharacterized protein LOC112456906 isoform X1 [Temnothorax curvispinosus]|uniref:Uncharacterized protein LOC112456906 isoform X1 n=1 Tax=Temnothorax curvispinosus TaxID=300111 RepID=A0A6J1Q1B9_9HYME|nr:uncharacterized protein LOC112456906 isoform X1 [Temnothorax curvispinosus]XP_024875472.1 uncharacterized protein LOC112456906 isoform X1 [Temnothorax curvispinosus]XP_024875473.1 uncharacterized protein LOC112456906 isoform X1 [Temnothorax curvispinosus]